MNSRQVALEILLDIEKNKSYSNISINKYLKKYDEKENSNFIREIVYGVLENTIYLDYMIRKKSHIRLKKIHPKTLMILRIGVYQICFLDRVPESAAVNESVKLVKKNRLDKSSGFVNGILRNIVREKDKVMKIENVKDNEYLSIRYSHPIWLVDNWIDEYGYEFTKSLLKANNSRPELNIRVNTLKTDRESLKNRLRQLGFIVKNTEYSSYGLIIENPKNIFELEEYKEGLFSIQDESSMILAELVKPRENSLVLDICSAPGGKTTHMAEVMKDKGRIVARDFYEHKVKLIDYNVKRLGIKSIETEVYDGLVLDKNLIGKVDYCLLDAPCSALGTIRRAPEIKMNRREDNISEIISLQKKLLDIASIYVKEGGQLIYSTCTINKYENEYMIRDFLKSNKDFKLVKVVDENLKDLSNEKNEFIEIYPNIHRMDGFFIAKLERINKNTINMI